MCLATSIAFILYREKCMKGDFADLFSTDEITEEEFCARINELVDLGICTVFLKDVIIRLLPKPVLTNMNGGNI